MSFPYSIVIYVYISCSGLITSVGEERAYFLLSFTCNYVVTVRRGFLFLSVIGLGCVICNVLLLFKTDQKNQFYTKLF